MTRNVLSCTMIVSVVLVSAVAQGQDFSLVERGKLEPTSPIQSNSHMGSSMALTESHLLVGVEGDETRGYDSGAVLVFEYDSTFGVWQQTQRLTASDATESIRFGCNLDATSTTLVVGTCPTSRSNKRAAIYIFEWDPQSRRWQQRKITYAPESRLRFAASVAVQDDFVAVGETARGSVFIYRRDSGGPANWGLHRQIGPNGNTFGNEVVLRSDVLVIGDYTEDRAHIHERNQGGPNHWGTVYSTSFSGTQEFGAEAAISADGNTVAISATEFSNGRNRVGAVMMYERTNGGWSRVQTLIGELGPCCGDPAFGTALSLTQDLLVVGQPAINGTGQAYVYTRSPSQPRWTQRETLRANPSMRYNYFGLRVAALGHHLFVGARNDNWRGSDSGSVSRFFTNLALVAVDDTFTVNEDGELDVSAPGVLDNDRDDDDPVIRATLDTAPAHGQVFLAENGGFRYVPEPDFYGTDTFTYTATSAPGDTATARVSISVSPVNDAPIAHDDDISMLEDQVLALDLLDNDINVDADPLSIVVLAPPTSGTLTFEGNQPVRYVPNPHFHGEDAFTYRLDDGVFSSEPAEVRISVRSVNDPPTAVEDRGYVTEEDTALRVEATAGVLLNDADIENDNLIARLVSRPSHGVLSSFESNGAFSYTPNPDFHGEDSFDYQASDGQNRSRSTRVFITVEPTNDAPIAHEDTFEVPEDGRLVLTPSQGVLANDIDADDDPLSATLERAPSNGTLALEANGGFVYTPQTNFFGRDSFSYTASDNQGTHSEPAVVTLVVSPVNDPPTARDDQFSLQEDSVLIANADNGLLNNDSDLEGGPLTVELVVGPSHGALELANDGSFRYQPEPDFNGDDRFTYRIQDQGQVSGEATVLLQVHPLDDPPYFLDPSHDNPVLALEDDTLRLEFLAVDPDGDALLYGMDGHPQGANLAATTGRFEWTPTWEDEGSWMITISVSDGISAIEQDVIIEASFLDQDGDGLPDTWETLSGLDPTTVDSDDDFIGDALEIGARETPNDTDGDGILDALDDDSDGDGISDAEEAGDEDLDTRPNDTDDNNLPDFRDPDSDGDGVEDGRDLCRLVHDPAQADTDRDGVGDACSEDLDGDGIVNNDDNCPRIANTDQMDTDEDLIGDACDTDDDGDNALDTDDNCTLTHNPMQGDVDNDGIGDACDDSNDPPEAMVQPTPNTGTPRRAEGCQSTPTGPNHPRHLLLMLALIVLMASKRSRGPQIPLDTTSPR